MKTFRPETRQVFKLLRITFQQSFRFFFRLSTYVFGTQVLGDVCAVFRTIAVGQLAFAGVATLGQVLRGFSDG